MPTDQDIALINAGSNLLGQSSQAMAQANLNKKTRKWNEMMHDKQRAEALADYQMQNEYNHPSAQMQRLRDAGLNPNLVYGNGVTTESANIRPAGVESWNPTAPKVDVGSAVSEGISTYYDVQMRKAQLDNLRTQNTVMEQEKLLKMAQVNSTLEQSVLTGTTNQDKLFNLEFKQSLKDTNTEIIKEQLRRLKTGTDISLDQNERAAVKLNMDLQTAAESILNMRASRANTQEQKNLILQQIQNLKKDERLKQLDINLKQNGIQPGDEIYWRVLGQYLSK